MQIKAPLLLSACLALARAVQLSADSPNGYYMVSTDANGKQTITQNAATSSRATWPTPKQPWTVGATATITSEWANTQPSNTTPSSRTSAPTAARARAARGKRTRRSTSSGKDAAFRLRAVCYFLATQSVSQWQRERLTGTETLRMILYP